MTLDFFCKTCGSKFVLFSTYENLILYHFCIYFLSEKHVVGALKFIYESKISQNVYLMVAKSSFVKSYL